MEHRCRQQYFSSGFCRFHEVFHFSGAAGCHDFRRTCLRHRPDDRQIITGFRAVTGFAGRQNNLHAEIVDLLGKIDRISAGRSSATVNVNLVSGGHSRVDVEVNSNRNGIDTKFTDKLFDKLRTAELVVFNRVPKTQDRMELHKLVRGISRGADILYETEDGKTEEDTFPDPLPFDLDAPIVDIQDEDYALFYRDLVEEPKKYEGKTVRYLGLVANPPRVPKDTLLIGRQIMECCVDDITYCPLVCRYEGARTVPHKSWAVVTGKLSIRFSNLYGKKGPVLTVTSLVPSNEPEEPVATFY